MNNYSRMNHNVLLIIKKATEQVRDKRLQSANNATNSDKIMRLYGRIVKLDHLLIQVNEAIQSGGTKRNKENAANYDCLSEDELQIVKEVLDTCKNISLTMEQQEKYATIKERDDNRRWRHQCNRVLSQVHGAWKRKHRLQSEHRRVDGVLEHVGETAYASDMKTVLTIIDWNNERDVRISFPDGRTLEHVKYNAFKNNRVLTFKDKYIQKHKLAQESSM